MDTEPLAIRIFVVTRRWMHRLLIVALVLTALGVRRQWIALAYGDRSSFFYKDNWPYYEACTREFSASHTPPWRVSWVRTLIGGELNFFFMMQADTGFVGQVDTITLFFWREPQTKPGTGWVVEAPDGILDLFWFEEDGWMWRHTPKNKFATRLTVPIWFVIAATSTYPILATFLLLGRRLRRWKRGLCMGCGYDLRGNTSGVCSECGRAIPAGNIKQVVSKSE